MQMDVEQALFCVVAFAVYYFGLIGAAGILDDAADIVWWPILLAKALLKSLYRALFTGWKL